MTRVCKQVPNLNKTGPCVEALAVELEAGRADALAVALPVELDAAGLGAPGVEARAPALDTTRIAFAFAFAFGLAFAFGFLAPESAARALRAVPNFHRLARTAIATLVFFASTASAPPKFLVRGPDARPDQQSVAVFAARFLTVSARKRKVFLPTSGASWEGQGASSQCRPKASVRSTGSTKAYESSEDSAAAPPSDPLG